MSEAKTRPTNPIFCAIDTASLEAAEHLAHSLEGRVGGLKLGLEFFGAHGPAGVQRIAEYGLPIFLDLKLHDIPNTVGGAVKALARLPVSFLTLHASGGRAMLQAAVDAVRDAADGQHPRPLKLLGVTVLTSLSADDLQDVGQDPVPNHQVDRLGFLVKDTGVDGIVCSAEEIAVIRERFGPEPILMVPGIRPGWSTKDDQKRVTTPDQALALGADYLVIGRPITRATDPAEAAERITEELALAAMKPTG